MNRFLKVAHTIKGRHPIYKTGNASQLVSQFKLFKPSTWGKPKLVKNYSILRIPFTGEMLFEERTDS